MKSKLIGFREQEEKVERLNRIADGLGMDLSDLIRRAVSHGLNPALVEIEKERKEALDKAKKMVRGTGFEPVTPTVSRFLQSFSVSHVHAPA